MNNFSTSTNLFSRNFSLNIGGHIVDLSSPIVMGIINATRDSFFKESRLPEPSAAVSVARNMLGDGAKILDIGAVSTRPGAEEISTDEEIIRLSPVVGAIRTEFPDCFISVDTWRSEVAKEMRNRFGIDMINDISAGQYDSQMFSTMAKIGIPYVMMHAQGKPEDMQESPEYKNVTDDILQFFGERVYNLKKLGITDIVIDPGFGFGKTLEQNYQLLRELDLFAMLELPIMVGLSRKSMIYNVLETDPANALNGTTSVHMAALLAGASILRVHDVKEAMETVKIFQQIMDRPSRSV